MRRHRTEAHRPPSCHPPAPARHPRCAQKAAIAPLAGNVFRLIDEHTEEFLPDSWVSARWREHGSVRLVLCSRRVGAGPASLPVAWNWKGEIEVLAESAMHPQR